MSARALWRDLVAGRALPALVPIAPILLLPFIIIGFVVIFPLWAASLLVLTIARGLAWLSDLALRKPLLKPKVDYAFEWVLTFAGLARKIRAKP